VRVGPSAAEGFASGFDDYHDGFDDDDDYVEYTLAPPRPSRTATPPVRAGRRRPTPAESWRSQLDDMTTTTEIERVVDAHNASHVDDDRYNRDHRPSRSRHRHPD
jgi:hypothetical protein